MFKDKIDQFQIQRFITLLNEAEQIPEKFISIALWLNVRILTDQFDKETRKAIPRTRDEIFEDCVVAFGLKSWRERMFMIQEFKKPFKLKGGEDNGINSNTKA